jgi:hypothetical protein
MVSISTFIVLQIFAQGAALFNVLLWGENAAVCRRHITLADTNMN